jgi:hypothetical protein
MESNERIAQLLEEIRDGQRKWIESYSTWVTEYRQRVESSVRMQEVSLRQQVAMANLYKRVVSIGAIAIMVVLAAVVGTVIYSYARLPR